MCHRCLQFLHSIVQKEESVSRVKAEVTTAVQNGNKFPYGNRGHSHSHAG